MLRRFFRFAMRRGNTPAKRTRFATSSRPAALTMDGTRQPTYLTAEEHAAWSQARYALQRFEPENP